MSGCGLLQTAVHLFLSLRDCELMPLCPTISSQLVVAPAFLQSRGESCHPCGSGSAMGTKVDRYMC